MTLFQKTITTTPSPAYADHKGTPIHPRTLRERRGVKWLTHLGPCTPTGENVDQVLVQPKGHLQPTVMNIPRRRRAPATDAFIPIPTPLSSPCTPPASLREPYGSALSIRFAHIIEELLKGYVQPEGQLQPPAMKRGGRGKKLLAPVASPFSPRTSPSDNGHSLSRTLRERRGITFGWQCGAQPKGHLEPTVINLPRRHKRNV
ncbi:hypothetical protein J132_01464 [Termitomyces sp. J132]|nr:hypothetical protein C0989_001331 [Termitomyces sp. Mn162]KAH0591611.1 hypothetical protein H2248_001664 [Termitomyces sp. 'cryptogamus']KNZ72951.1 hypothetical protein J132_01464 [Termitomyces sp. J132]